MATTDWAALRQEALGSFQLTSLPPDLQLPALPLAVTRFLEHCEEEADLKVLAGIVETDTGLTLELLKHVNSSAIGLRQRAKSAAQALQVLGIRQSKMFMVTTGTQAAVRARKSRLLPQHSFWSTSLQRALFAREVAALLGTDRETAFAGGLLQDFLLPVLTNELFDDYTEFVSHRTKFGDSIVDFERQRFGWDHAVLGACLAHQWKLPDDLICCMFYHHHGLRVLAHGTLVRTPVAAVALSSLLPDHLRQESCGLQQLARLQESWRGFQLLPLAETVDAEHALLATGVGNTEPLAKRAKAALEQLAPVPV